MGVDQARLVKLATGLLAAAAVATGCSVDEDGNPNPTSGTSAPDETGGAPPVEHPLDASRFLAEPCAVLRQQQMAEFDVTRPGVPTTTGATAETVGPFCTWHADPGGSIGIGFETGNKNGLSDTYRGRDQFAYFEPTTVDGYPAVFSGDPDLRDQGSCLIGVGISDNLAFNASELGKLDAEGACERARQVAAAALKTLKEGGG